MADDQVAGSAASFEAHRVLLGAVAHRILGTVADAEDVVQETWLRWAAADRAEVSDPRAFLVTVASRLALNALRTRARRREVYPGPWLPEPTPGAPDDGAGDPGFSVLRAESVSLGFLVVLESLTPAERVVFVLHDVFAFSHAEIAETLERTPAAVRQLASRARRRVQERRHRAAPDPAEHAQVVAAFMRAATDGDVAALLAVLAPDVVLLTDGGGAVKAALRPIVGADKTSRFLAAISREVPEVGWVHGSGDVLVLTGETLLAVVDIESDHGRVGTVRVQLNPAKLSTGGVAARPGGA